MYYKLLILSISLPLFLLAQKDNKTHLDKPLSLANIEFNQGRYAYAIPLYKTVLKSNSSDSIALMNLGISYKMIGAIDSAICYFEKAKSTSSKSIVYLAELYANKDEYKKAVINFSKVELSQPSYKKRMEGFENVKYFMLDSLDYTIKYLKINTSFNEYNATPYKNGIVFESNWSNKINGKNEYGLDGNSFTKLYFANDSNLITKENISKSDYVDKKIKRSITNYTSTTANDNNTLFSRFDFKRNQIQTADHKIFSKELDQSYNYGAISFTKDGLHAYYTKNQTNAKLETKLEIWSTEFVNGKWINQKKLSFNNLNASYFHPAITQDGKKLYFVSDCDGGIGGTDIYSATLNDDSSWSQPQNIKQLNTGFNELFPTLYEGRLFFSSNGYGGIGGLDVYEFTSIGEIVNLGYPINSRMDDFGFSIQNKKGYFSSNRNGTDDIFSFDYDESMVVLSGNILVIGSGITDSIKQSVINNTHLKVYLIDELGQQKFISETQPSISSTYSLKLRPNRKYLIIADDQNGHSDRKEFNTFDHKKVVDIQTGKIEYTKSIPFLQLKIPTPLIVEQPQIVKLEVLEKYNILYQLDKSFITKRYTQVLDSLIIKLLYNQNLHVVIGSFADCASNEQYNLQLSFKRSNSVIKYLLAHGITKDRIIENHYGKNYLIVGCVDGKYNSKKQQVNRRTEIITTEISGKNWEDLNSDNKLKMQIIN